MANLWERIYARVAAADERDLVTRRDEAAGDVQGAARSSAEDATDVASSLRERLVAFPSPASDAYLVVCDLLPKPVADTIHRVALMDCSKVEEAKTLKLLHKEERTSHYFNCDAFLTRESDARRFVSDAVGEIVAILEPAGLACSVAGGEGLMGTYPLCFHLGLAMQLDVAAILRSKVDVLEIVGRNKAPQIEFLIVNDVLTTGTSIVQVADMLRDHGASVSGAVVIYDRQEGGAATLEERGIPYLAVMSRRSLRSYCHDVANDPPAPDDLREKAEFFLRRSSGLIVQTFDAAAMPLDRPRIATALAAAPPADAFDENRQLLPDARTTQIEVIRGEIASAHASGCAAVVFPELTVPLEMREGLRSASRETGMVIIGGAEYDDYKQNLGLVAIGGELIEQPKLVRSPYDLPSLSVGDQVHVVTNTPIGDFAMLVCADQWSYRLMEAIRNQVQVVVVVSRNMAWDTFARMAAGDAYRLNSYLVCVNDANLGRSYVASPEKGESKHRWLDPGSEGTCYVELDIRGLTAGSDRFHRRLPD